jgi:Xaa-Pro aminopeptidase
MLMHFRYTVAPSFIDSILKAIKSEMGFEGLRRAYLRDGAAYVRTLAWCVLPLTHQVGSM